MGLTGLSGLSGLSAVVGSGGDAPPSYTRTAFVSSSGNDGTAALNDPAKPYLTITAAVTALYGADASPGTNTVILQSSVNGTHTVDRQAIAVDRQILIDGQGSYAVQSLVINSPASPGETNIALKDVTITNVSTDQGCAADLSTGFGVIDFQGNVSIGTFELQEPGTPQASAGSDGEPAFDGFGASGGDGTSSDFGGGEGSPGEFINSTAGNGADGEAGKAAWSVNLNAGGTCTGVSIGTVNLQGCQGGQGGSGGGNTGAWGGNGGNGGAGTDSMALGNPVSGGNGGAGGDCYITGGNGGNGGKGGDGGSIALTGINSGNITLTTTNLVGGFGGYHGTGGNPGGATGGTGGMGGPGVNGGTDGSYGSNGNSGTTIGGDGTDGTTGMGGMVL